MSAKAVLLQQIEGDEGLTQKESNELQKSLETLIANGRLVLNVRHYRDLVAAIELQRFFGELDRAKTYEDVKKAQTNLPTTNLTPTHSFLVDVALRQKALSLFESEKNTNKQKAWANANRSKNKWYEKVLEKVEEVLKGTNAAKKNNKNAEKNVEKKADADNEKAVKSLKNASSYEDLQKIAASIPKNASNANRKKAEEALQQRAMELFDAETNANKRKAWANTSRGKNSWYEKVLDSVTTALAPLVPNSASPPSAPNSSAPSAPDSSSAPSAPYTPSPTNGPAPPPSNTAYSDEINKNNGPRVYVNGEDVEKKEEGWAWWIYVIIGVAALFVIFVIVIVVVSVVRKKRREREEQIYY